jgi:hypothetical protein
MSSPISMEIIKKYTINNTGEDKSKEIPEVNFERIKSNIEIQSKGKDFYESIKKLKGANLSKEDERKIDSIISDIIKLNDITEGIIKFESELLFDIRKNSPEIFDQIDTTQNILLESTLKFIILKYNQAIENGIDLKEFFVAIEKNSSQKNNKYSSVYSKIATNLTIGVPPTVKEIELASYYFKDDTHEKKDTFNLDDHNISLNALRQMVEWDSKMKILSQGERAYLADLAYELKALSSFHKTNAKKHLKTLLKAGFELK